MTDDRISSLRERLSRRTPLSFEESFELLRACGQLLNSRETEDNGRDLVIRGLEYNKKLHAACRTPWHDLLVAAGLHPYVEADQTRGVQALRHEAHRSKSLDAIFLHSEQLHLSSLLSQGHSVVVSAPTSFGKSLLIEELVARRRYQNIAIIQPTLALLDETRKKLDKYADTYRLVVSTQQQASAEKNIFLLTAERLVEYAQLPSIDFFVIDEFYKLSIDRDDDRAITLNQALHRLLKHTKHFYMLGPNVSNVSPELVSQYKAIWHKSSFATVSVDVNHVYKDKNWGRNSQKEREEELFRLLQTLSGPVIIYCAGPEKAMQLASAFTSIASTEARANNKRTPRKCSEIIDWVRENIHERWSLASSLEAGVGFHHGNMPRHLSSAVVDAFGDGSIKHLFCTSTLIEGVNTPARHVILFDKKKGRKAIDYFDYKNIVGRSGRMKIHYLGHVHAFHPEPKEVDLEVDIALFNQASAPLELLAALSEEELSEEAKPRLEKFASLDPTLQSIIRRNSGISLEGQMKVAAILQDSPLQHHHRMNWNSVPTYEQLLHVLELCWNHFLRPNESKGEVRNPAQLTLLTLDYSHMKSLRLLIGKSIPYWRQRLEPNEAIQKAVNLVLSTARTWFEYKLPKWLSGISAIQSYVFENAGLVPGNYAYLSAAVENSFIAPSLSVLRDYDIPTSAVRKLERHVRRDLTWQELVAEIGRLDLTQIGLLPYELSRIEALLRNSGS